MKERNTHKHTHIIYVHICCCLGASLVAHVVKNPAAMRETWVRSLGQEDALEKEMAPHSSILAWNIPWTVEPGRLYSTWGRRVGHGCTTNTKCYCLVSKSCLTFYDPMNYNPPGSSVHGISQARKLERVAISFYRGSSQPRDLTHISCIGRRILYHLTTKEAHMYKYVYIWQICA